MAGQAWILRMKTKRWIVDAAMVLLLPVLMAYSLVGEALHEVVGTLMLVLFLLHHWLNRAWLKGLFRGRYTPRRVFQTAINLLLLTLTDEELAAIAKVDNGQRYYHASEEALQGYLRLQRTAVTAYRDGAAAPSHRISMSMILEFDLINGISQSSIFAVDAGSCRRPPGSSPGRCDRSFQ